MFVLNTSSPKTFRRAPKKRSPDGGSVLEDEAAFHPLDPPPISRPLIRICVRLRGRQGLSGNRPLQTRGERSSPGFHQTRSEERRVGKECRSRWSPYH